MIPLCFRSGGKQVDGLPMVGDVIDIKLQSELFGFADDLQKRIGRPHR